METYINDVTLQGKLIAKRWKEGADIGSYIIETTVSKDRKQVNRQMVMLFKNTISHFNDFNVGDYICIHGKMGTRPVIRKGKTASEQHVIAESIGKAQSRLEKDYGLEGQMYDKINEVRIGGIVTGISTPSDKLCYIMLQTVKGGHPSAILTKVFINQYNQEFLKSIKRGDNLIVCGTIQSKQRKSKEGKNLYFENLIGMDMSKIEETKVS